MKKVLIGIACMLLLGACEKNAKQNIWSVVTLHAHLPDGGSIVSMEVDMSLKGNYFRNINSLLETEIPVFVNNACTLRMVKGVYTLSFDADALFSDGTEHRVRCAEHNAPNRALNILDDCQEINLELIVLK